MARISRLVVPGLPHHVTQRGNGRGRVFFSDADYELYLSLLADNCRVAGVECLAYCLMPNHIQLILVPQDEDGLRAVLAPTHRRYAGLINARRRKTGHFWQGRYGAAVMDEDHAAAAFRSVLRSPVLAKLVKNPEDYQWSSARAYLQQLDDGLTTIAPMVKRFPDIASLICEKKSAFEDIAMRADQTVGRPLGDQDFFDQIEKATGRKLAPGKRGPKGKWDAEP